MNPRGPHPAAAQSEAAFRGTRLLTAGYLTVSVLTLVAVILLRHHHSLVNDAVWTRGVIVVASAAVTYTCAVRAAKGSRGAFRRLRVISAAMVAAIVVIIALPGTFPLWMKIDQGFCGALLLMVAVLVNGRRLRSLFDGHGSGARA
ncbi:hypothetical protein [Streptomyces sp. NPDC050560]|uniref:hypothetical protein n=1 Tax=Streptomyces sp. NPDC050560 TaxID=3365630 RepID=UPI00379245BA